MQLGQPRVKRTRSQSTRTQSIRRTSLRDKMNTTKRDVQDEKLYFIQSIDGQKTNIPSQNGHRRESPEKDIVDIKDVELTLLPSYLHDQENHNKVIDNTDLLQNISKPNPQLSPPKRPPRTSQSPDGPIERVNVQVNVNTAHASMNHAPSAGTPPDGSAQTLADLKKQRSMHRVAQQSPRSSDNQRNEGRSRGSDPSGVTLGAAILVVIPARNRKKTVTTDIPRNVTVKTGVTGIAVIERAERVM